MLIICCGMPRSGSTLQYQIVKRLINSIENKKIIGWVDSFDDLELAANISNNNTVLVKMHDYPIRLNSLKEVFDIKLIYSYRDIRDVVVSIMNKTNKTYNEVFSNGFVTTFKYNFYHWTNEENIYIARYEYLKNNISSEAKAMAEYLNLCIGIDYNNIEVELSIDSQIRRIKSSNFEEIGMKGWDSVYHKDELLHQNHIFSGDSNQWKGSLNFWQILKLEYCFYGWLKKNNYKKQILII